ncbi:MAG TPA: GntR family transcriptional regulator [Acidocella sp.]|jgi:DNA-binding GntR family transcriptional regulator|nr:GntR family transcriptional regulator [Acidocella sp.]
MSEAESAVLRAAKWITRPVDRETIQDRVYSQIKAMIINGEIEPGEAVTIQSLSEAFQVSAMPVREALRRLMAEQALTVLSGRSVGVPPLSPERLADLRRVRGEIEGTAVRWAAEKMTPQDLGELTRLVETLEDAEARSDSKLYVSANHHFHFRIYRLAGSATLLAFIESLWLQISPYFHVLRGSGNWHAANVAHRAMLEALATGDGPTAAAALRRDIDGAATILAARLGGTAKRD